MMLTLGSRISGTLFHLANRVSIATSRRYRDVVDSESGATAMEYGLIAAGIGVAVALVVFIFGNDISAYYQAIDTRLTARTLT